MSPRRRYRDIDDGDESVGGVAGEGRRYVMAIGIDRYRAWPTLRNAVNDARGAVDAFRRLGFEQLREPLLDEAATHDALRTLVLDELRELKEEDSLVLFFAGHGYTNTRTMAGGGKLPTGYLIPVDAARPGGSLRAWLDLNAWLTDVDALPMRHILVILDACHSGVSLPPRIQHHGPGIWLSESMDHLRERRSRRVFVSAQAGEQALDNGPVHGHSLFTGTLIEALQGGFFRRKGQRVVRAIDIWNDVYKQVIEYPASKQSPDFGTLNCHDGGDLVLELYPPPPKPLAAPWLPSGPPKYQPAQEGISNSRSPDGLNPSGTRKRQRGNPEPSKPELVMRGGAPPSGPVSRVDGSQVDDAFVAALDLQDAQRRRGGAVLSLIEGDARAAMDWAAWAAGRGYLTLITEGKGIEAAIDDLLAQIPWLRCLSMARRTIAAAEHIHVDAVEAAFDSRSERQQNAWLGDLADFEPRVRVSGWLLAALRSSGGRVPDVAGAPLQGGVLLAALCELAMPVAVLVQHTAPTSAWLDRAIKTAAELLSYLPGHPIALSAPAELSTRTLSGRSGSAFSMARQGRVRPGARRVRLPSPARDRTVQVLLEALGRDPRVGRRFERGAQVQDGGRAVPVDLVAKDARFAVMLDGWYRSGDPQGYQNDRSDDARLRRAGYFVMRFTAEDIDGRLPLVVNEIAVGLASRGAPLALRGGRQW